MAVSTARAAWAVILLGVLGLAGCATGTGSIDLTNDTEDEVTVRFRDEHARADLGADGVVDLPETGGVSIPSGRCYDGPLLVTYADGRTLEVPGPVCPGQELVVRDEVAELRESQNAG